MRVIDKYGTWISNRDWDQWWCGLTRLLNKSYISSMYFIANVLYHDRNTLGYNTSNNLLPSGEVKHVEVNWRNVGNSWILPLLDSDQIQKVRFIKFNDKYLKTPLYEGELTFSYWLTRNSGVCSWSVMGLPLEPRSRASRKLERGDTAYNVDSYLTLTIIACLFCYDIEKNLSEIWNQWNNISVYRKWTRGRTKATPEINGD